MPQSQSQTVAARLAAALRRHDVDVIFGQSLPSALILAAEDIGIRQVVYRTENAGGAMADGYARTTGKIGIVTAQNGPAATLLVPPFAEALKASIPLLGLVQEVERSMADRNAFQELDHFKLFEGSTKWVRRLSDPARVDDYVDMAIMAAISGRPGPAVLLLPADLLKEPAEPLPHQRSMSLGHWPFDRPRADTRSIAIAAEKIANARHPVMIAGGGVHGSCAASAFAQLQDVAHLPVGYTMMGKGSVSDLHPLTLGLLGNVVGKLSLGRLTKPIVDEADVVLLVGTRTNQNATNNWTSIPRDASVIHIDVDPEEIGRTYEADVRLVGDARATIEELTAELRGRDLTPRLAARDGIAERIARAKRDWRTETEYLWASDATPLRPERIMAELARVISPDTTVVADASYSSVWINSCLQAQSIGQRFLAPRGLAGLGWGYPMALGVQAGHRDKTVVSVVGDGGFGHCWSELETAVRMNLPVILIVLNNSVLGFQKDAETVKFGRYTSACHFNAVDHAAIARACGVEGYRVESAAELAERLDHAIKVRRPVLLDVITDPSAFPPISLFDAL